MTTQNIISLIIGAPLLVFGFWKLLPKKVPVRVKKNNQGQKK